MWEIRIPTQADVEIDRYELELRSTTRRLSDWFKRGVLFRVRILLRRDRGGIQW